MPLIYTVFEKDFKVGVWEITESEEELLDNLFLSNEEKKYLCKIKLSLKRKQWLSYRKIINEFVGAENYKGIYYNANGKPFLNELAYNISVSHTQNYSVAIISSSHKVGIDIEPIKERILKIEHKFLSKNEANLLPLQNRTKLSHIAWGAKEAIYKIKDDKNLIFAENLEMQTISDKQKDVLFCEYRKETEIELFKIYYEALKHLMLVYAVPK